MGKPEVVLDPRAGPGLAAWRPRLGHERPHPLRAAVHRGREPGRPGSEHDEIEALTVDLGTQAERPRDLGRRRVAHHVRGVHEHRSLGARDVEPLEHRGAVGVRVGVVPVHRQQVALEQVPHLERAPGVARGDQAHHAVALRLVPRASCQQRAEDVLAELGPARDHVAQGGAVERDHVRRLDRHAGAERRLAGEHGDVADERAAVGLRDIDVLAGLAVDELDQAVLDHVERRVADGVLVEDLAGLEGPVLAALGEPRQLAVGEPREDHLVIEVGEPLTAYDPRRRHRTRGYRHAVTAGRWSSSAACRPPEPPRPRGGAATPGSARAPRSIASPGAAGAPRRTARPRALAAWCRRPPSGTHAASMACCWRTSSSSI